jgi:NADP-dependent 3-hydroxy acid dehydrogenase YdfG
MSQGIKDKVIVITGASSGLGEAAARRLARDGAKIVLGARRIERLQALAKELSLGPDAAVPTDVTQHEQVCRLVDHAVKRHGRIDVMINNAGLMPHSPLERGKVADWNRMIDVNIKGVLYGIAAALPHMKVQKSGHIVNVSSGSSGASRKRRICRYQARGACDFGRAAPGGQAVQYPLNHHLARCGRDRTYR